MRPRGSWCLLLAALALVLTSCHAGYTARDDDSGSRRSDVTIALTAAPANLDFTTTSGAAIPQALMGNVYETLVKVDQEGELVPGLARSWEVDQDRTGYTFHLQQGVTFSDGSDFDAHSVKFSLDRVRSSAWSNGLKAGMDVVQRVRVVDPATVEVTLKRPSQSWLWTLSTLTGAMFTPSGVEHLKTRAVGTGPFVVDRWKSGQSLSLARREDYWGRPAAAGRVTLRYYSDPVTATNALRGSAVQAIVALQAPDLVPGFKADPDFTVQEGTSTGEILLSMNNRRAPFDDPRVRKAVMYAVDRQAVMDASYGGRGSLIGAAVAPTDAYYEDLSDAYPHDPERARKLLRQAGIEGETITFSVPSLPYATAASQVIVSDLADVGLHVRIEQQEFPAVWLDRTLTRHDYQLSVVAHVEPRDVLDLLGPDYYLGYDWSRIADQVRRADTGSDADYVEGMRAAVRRAFVDDAVADPLFLMPNLTVARRAVVGLPRNSPTTALDLTRVTTDGAS